MKKNTDLLLTGKDLSVMYTHTFTKKDAEQAGANLVDQIIEEGEVDEYKVWANIVRLKEVASSADAAFRTRLNPSVEQSSMGVSFTPKNGAKKLNYGEDLVYAELATKLKERAELLKVAHNSKDVIFDADGMEVTKVTSYFDKSSITVKF